MASLQFSKTGFDEKRKYVLFVFSEAVETKLLKLETSRAVILPQQRWAVSASTTVLTETCVSK